MILLCKISCRLPIAVLNVCLDMNDHNMYLCNEQYIYSNRTGVRIVCSRGLPEKEGLVVPPGVACVWGTAAGTVGLLSPLSYFSFKLT